MQTVTTSFRAGDVDLRRWRRAAEEAGLSWSEWIRSALLAYEERGTAPAAAVLPEPVYEGDVDPETDGVDEF